MGRVKTQRCSIHYGWIIVLACFFISGGGIGILINTLGTFIKPVSTAMGYTRAQYSMVTSLSHITAMITYPLWGWYLRKHSIRKAMLVTGALIPMLLLGFSLCSQLWQFYLCALLLGMMTGSFSTLPVTSLVNAWFDDLRGTATGLGSCGSGLAMVMIPAVSAVITAYGWRTAYRFTGLTFFLIIEFCAILLLRDKPQDKGLLPYRKAGTTEEIRPVWGITRTQALKSTCFWLFLPIAFLSGACNTSITNHIYAYLTDLGFSTATASVMVSLQMLFLMLSKLSLGLIFDRLGLRAGMLCSISAYGLSAVFLFLGRVTPPVIYLGLICAGIGSALPAMSMAYTTRQLFGSREYSANCSVVLSAVFFGNTVGTSFTGWIYDRFGSYAPAWGMVLCMSTTMGVLFFAVLSAHRRLRLTYPDIPMWH
ncbi:MAG: MFS transporter [Oscillospiraceae bacterium]|nr:MFS transporter [Oscillospiraceae bacterium]